MNVNAPAAADAGDEPSQPGEDAGDPRHLDRMASGYTTEEQRAAHGQSGGRGGADAGAPASAGAATQQASELTFF